MTFDTNRNLPIVGNLINSEFVFAIVCSRFNDTITKRLLEGANDALIRHGVSTSDIYEIWVPGAFEIPVVAKTLAETGRYNAIICLGAIIRGSTGHYDQVANQCASGIQKVQIDTAIPTIFGVLTTDTIEQAIERSGTKAGNKGYESGLSALEMANLMKQLDKKDF